MKKPPCNHELIKSEFPTCKICGEIWWDMVGYNRSIELAKRQAEATAKEAK